MKIEEFKNKILLGDCLDVMKGMPDNSVDSVVTDPPAGISFMGKSWDTFDKDMFGKKGEEGENDLKVKKNFNILPRYGNSDIQGFQDFICEVFLEVKRILKPGGHCLVWAIPRTSHHTAMGLERAGFEIRDCVYHIFGSGFPKSLNLKEVMPGWGTALKPAVECWWLIRKPLSEKTVAENMLKWGTGGINVDGSRVGENPHYRYPNGPGGSNKNTYELYAQRGPVESILGRFPANLIHEGIEENWARFFYCAKTSASEKNNGLDNF